MIPNGKSNQELTRRLALGTIIYAGTFLLLVLIAYFNGGETNNTLRFLRFAVFPIVSVYLSFLLARYFGPKLIGVRQSNSLLTFVFCSISIYVVVFSTLKFAKLNFSNYEFFDAK